MNPSPEAQLETAVNGEPPHRSPNAAANSVLFSGVGVLLLVLSALLHRADVVTWRGFDAPTFIFVLVLATAGVLFYMFGTGWVVFCSSCGVGRRAAALVMGLAFIASGVLLWTPTLFKWRFELSREAVDAFVAQNPGNQAAWTPVGWLGDCALHRTERGPLVIPSFGVRPKRPWVGVLRQPGDPPRGVVDVPNLWGGGDEPLEYARFVFLGSCALGGDWWGVEFGPYCPAASEPRAAADRDAAAR